MSSLGLLLEAAKKKAGGAKKAAGGITIKIGGAGAGGAAKTDAAKKPSSKKRGEGAVMRDLLKHHDEASTFHRQKAHEHGRFVEFHKTPRLGGDHDSEKNLADLNKEAMQHHEGLRRVYRRLGDLMYKSTRPKDKKKELKKKGKKK